MSCCKSFGFSILNLIIFGWNGIDGSGGSCGSWGGVGSGGGGILGTCKLDVDDLIFVWSGLSVADVFELKPEALFADTQTFNGTNGEINDKLSMLWSTSTLSISFISLFEEFFRFCLLCGLR